jgi:outer membrane immunogenic protein
MTMRRFNCAALAAVAVIGFASVASAADTPVKAAPMVAPVAAVSWTGWYVGLNAGGTWGTSQISTSTSAAVANPIAFNPATIAIINNVGAPANINTSGFTGGAQGGYNYQMGQWLVGIEADFEFFRSKGSINAVDPTGTVTLNSSFSTNWLFTARPRLGFISNNWLFYGTGGLAVTRISAAWNLGVGATVSENTSAPTTKAGWVVGGGVETMLPGKWLIGVEYLYVNFGSVSATGFAIAAGPTLVSNPINHSADLNANIVRARLSKLF